MISYRVPSPVSMAFGVGAVLLVVTCASVVVVVVCLPACLSVCLAAASLSFLEAFAQDQSDDEAEMRFGHPNTRRLEEAGLRYSADELTKNPKLKRLEKCVTGCWAKWPE